MLRATLKSLLARKLRLAMSGFAIVLGVAFVAGSLVFTDTLQRSFDEIFGSIEPDVVVAPRNELDVAAQQQFPTADTRRVPVSVITQIASVEGAARADGDVEAEGVYVLDKDGKVASSAGAPGLAFNWTDYPAFDGSLPVTLVQGEPPAGPNEIVIDVKTAERTGYLIGDTVPLVSSGPVPRIAGELVGIAQFGDTGNLVGATLTFFDTPTAQRLLLGEQGEFSRVSVTAEDGVSAETLRDQVEQALPPGLEAETGQDIAAENSTALQENLRFLNIFLLVFAAVSLLVGTFLIVNTFSILVAQRTRELALFRALGAGRRQVTRSVLGEALVIGVLGSTLGLASGFLLAIGLKALFGFIGLDLGDAGLVFRPRTALVAYVVGTLVTLVAAYGPAHRASKVPPVAAMRDDVALPESSLRRRLIGGLALSLVGAAVLTAGLLGATGNPVSLVGAGVFGVFVGVALLSPYLGRPVVRGIGAVYPRLFGTVGRLARENALRNPRRTAATASALMIGLALVTAMSIFGQSTKSSIDELVTGNLEADYVVSNVFQAPFSPTIAAEISRQDGVGSVSQVRYSAATVDAESTLVVGIDPATFFEAVAIDVTAGDAAGLLDGGVLVAGSRAEREGWGVGDSVSVGLPAGSEQHTIAGLFEESPVVGSDLVLSLDALREGGVQPADAVVYVNAQAGAEPASVRARIDDVLAGLPTVTLKDQAEFAAEQRASIDPLLYIIYALLGLAITIAVLGIVNTLALSVIERTREVGLLRAVGLSRRQLRTMIRLESVAVALLGAVLGVALGLVFGISLQQALADQGIAVLSVPVGQLLLFVVLAGLVGVLAAVWPARRAARLDVLRAISTQ